MCGRTNRDLADKSHALQSVAALSSACRSSPVIYIRDTILEKPGTVILDPVVHRNMTKYNPGLAEILIVVSFVRDALSLCLIPCSFDLGYCKSPKVMSSQR